ncbi:hypothetical protein FA09DRAFT_340712 [Tilletiopsis washingtonensis]|uniref:Uncharacterized protein n=1 Tax=Tilletiopsis washingtonensis TaxID=58919 RepID=A0A316Z307_9BASI|nr:hypothetical protein FA09DRAFT_340712 [Tilletiopsis washingtonensis]PWN95766.1 hypothetical protein FA09DRAFT_340712 [Tilletiopsis washingtonensis]
MHFLASVVALFSALMLVSAIDERVLVKFNDSKGGVDYCKQWKCACVNYQPKDTSYEFAVSGAYCNPGDFQGRNPDSEAKVYCVFTNGKDTKTVNKHIAAATGGTLSS